MRIFNFTAGKGEQVLRLGGCPLVQWLAIVWILAALSAYFNAELGFGPVANLFR